MLRSVFVTVTMAPLTPFLVEDLYQSLKPALPEEMLADSVHYLSFPTADESIRDPAIEAAVASMRKVIVMARVLRDQIGRSSKYPLAKMIVIHSDAAVLDQLATVAAYVKDEANVEDIVFETDFAKYVDARAEPNHRALGPRLGKGAGKVFGAIKRLDTAAVAAFLANGELALDDGVTLAGDDMTVSFVKREATDADATSYEVITEGAFVVLLDTTFDQTLENKGLARDILSRVQKLRKSSGLVIADSVDVWVDLAAAPFLEDVLAQNAETITNVLGAPVRPLASRPALASSEIARETQKLNGAEFDLVFTRPVALLTAQDAPPALAAFVATLNVAHLAAGDILDFEFDGTAHHLVVGEDVVVSSNM